MRGLDCLLQWPRTRTESNFTRLRTLRSPRSTASSSAAPQVEHLAPPLAMQQGPSESTEPGSHPLQALCCSETTRTIHSRPPRGPSPTAMTPSQQVLAVNHTRRYCICLRKLTQAVLALIADGYAGDAVHELYTDLSDWMMRERLPDFLMYALDRLEELGTAIMSVAIGHHVRRGLKRTGCCRCPLPGAGRGSLLLQDKMLALHLITCLSSALLPSARCTWPRQKRSWSLVEVMACSPGFGRLAARCVGAPSIPCTIYQKLGFLAAGALLASRVHPPAAVLPAAAAGRGSPARCPAEARRHHAPCASHLPA